VLADLLTGLVVAATKTPDEEGKDIVLSMLVVGLIFLTVIALGEIAYAIAKRRGRR
jgi:hypothetical protein